MSTDEELALLETELQQLRDAVTKARESMGGDEESIDVKLAKAELNSWYAANSARLAHLRAAQEAVQPEAGQGNILREAFGDFDLGDGE